MPAVPVRTIAFTLPESDADRVSKLLMTYAQLVGRMQMEPTNHTPQAMRLSEQLRDVAEEIVDTILYMGEQA